MNNADRNRMENIVRKVLLSAQHPEMPLDLLLRSHQQIVWFINHDPRWSASLMPMAPAVRQTSANFLSQPAKRLFELAVEEQVVLRATLQGADLRIGYYQAGSWEAWFGSPDEIEAVGNNLHGGKASLKVNS